MKKLYVVIGTLVILGFVGCSSKGNSFKPYYNKANKAASEAHKNFK